jgi:hypothetical protein
MKEDGERITSFFNFLGIAGIQFEDSGETRFLIGNARTGVTVTSLHRERILPGQGEHYE